MKCFTVNFGNYPMVRGGGKVLSPVRQWSKWWRMIAGTSILHAPQGPGAFFVENDIQGYYNDLRHKVGSAKHLDPHGTPLNVLASGRKIYFATNVAQYGLGAFDLFLDTGSNEHLKKALSSADWLIDNQDDRGGWDVWKALGIDSPIKYSAMTQGEGASLLFRTARETSDDRYFAGAERALELMLQPHNQGGPAHEEAGRLYLEELTTDPPGTILNGWIFAIFGLHDGVLATERKDFKLALERTLEALAAELSDYDNGYWSLYDRLGHLASPFYHDLHISLLESCDRLFLLEPFGATLKRWQEYRETPRYRRKAFLAKGWQKLREPNNTVITE